MGAAGFADDTAAAAPTVPELQRAADVAFQYSRKWRFSANVDKSAVIVFGTSAQTATEDTVTWGGAAVPRAQTFPLLGCVFAANGRWSAHVKQVIEKWTQRLHVLHSLYAAHLLPVPLKLGVLQDLLAQQTGVRL